jgi:chloramphenicol-sensitive protein RarD
MDVNGGIEERHQTVSGSFYATVAFLIWGGFPAYFKLLDAVPTLELLAHRISWSVVIPLLILFLFRPWKSIIKILKNTRKMKILCLSAMLIAANWYLFIWAATNNHVLDSSLGYFIAPLFSIFLGVIILGEKLRIMQWAALAITVVGVAVLVIQYGQIPWIAILIAITFSSYALIRKVVNVDPITGLFFETTMSLPITVGYLSYLGYMGSGSFISSGVNSSLLLIGTGLISTLPLLFFIASAKRLKLTSLGFFQYLLPTCHFVLAVWIYKEPFSYTQLISFACIWIALAIYTFDIFRNSNDKNVFSR